MEQSFRVGIIADEIENVVCLFRFFNCLYNNVKRIRFKYSNQFGMNSTCGCIKKKQIGNLVLHKKLRF